MSNKLENTFLLDTEMLNQYSLMLPTTWNSNIDWNRWKKFYIDFRWVKMRASIFRSTMLKQYKFPGRFEKEKYGFYTTVGYNEFSKWRSSISFRYSILYYGINKLVKLYGDDTLNTLGIVLILGIPILSQSTTKKGKIF